LCHSVRGTTYSNFNITVNASTYSHISVTIWARGLLGQPVVNAILVVSVFTGWQLPHLLPLLKAVATNRADLFLHCRVNFLHAQGVQLARAQWQELFI